MSGAYVKELQASAEQVLQQEAVREGQADLAVLELGGASELRAGGNGGRTLPKEFE
jgi:hypothetical protein